MVPFLEVRAAYEELREEIDAAVARVLHSGRYILGSEVEAFEAAFASYVGTRHCVGVGSGTAALELALEGMNVRGGEVIVPANTFIGTWLAVSRVGATPVPVEPDERTYNVDPGRIEEAITPATRAIIPVHLYGQPAAMNPILEVARRHDLPVLEDAAQAHGARYRGARAGALGTAAAWSFYPGKNLGALGDGGAVTTDDDDLADQIRLLRNFGARTKFDNERRGTNNRLDELQAAVLRVKLAHLDEWNDRRRRLAARYRAELAPAANVVLPHVPPDVDPVWHLFVVRTPRRDDLLRDLQAAGIEAGLHYPVAPHLQPAYADLPLKRGDLPVSERLHAEVLSLPIGPHLSEVHARRVIEGVLSSGAVDHE